MRRNRLWHHVALRSTLAGIAALVACGPENSEPSAAAQQPRDEGEACEAEEGNGGDDGGGNVCEVGGDRFYAHPLQGIEPVGGQYPFLDRRLSPSGRVYALVQAGFSPAPGEYEELENGVVELERKPIAEEELAALEAVRPVDHGVYVHRKVSSALESAVARAQGELLDVRILVQRESEDTVTLRLHRAIADGMIETESDRREVRASIMDDIAVETSATLEPVVTYLASLGVVPDHIGEHVTTIHARVPATAIQTLAERADVVRIDLAGVTALAGADGQSRAEAMQYSLFWHESYACGVFTCNYEGDNGVSTDIYVAVVDPLEFHDEHVAFRESSSSSSERIIEMWDCNSNPCVSRADGFWNPPEGSHGTRVLGTLMGDLKDAQDSGVTDPDDREDRSGSAGEAVAYLYEGDYSDLGRVMDHVSAQAPAPHFLVSSMGDPGTQPDWGDCNGDTTTDAEVDQMFENGVGFFVSAGNDLVAPSPPASFPWDDNGTDGSTSNCTLWDPASALAAFTVGAYDDEDGDVCGMRSSLVSAESAWGGATADSSEGRLRSSIDALGPWGVAAVADSASTTSYVNVIGTSFANPAVAGAAAAFIDMMKNLRGNNGVDDPGMLYAWMLNNTDRSIGGLNNWITSGYHQRAGGGHLNTRYVGNAGLDSPWWWYQWELCVEHGEDVELSINGGSALSASADRIRATAWWYDRRFNGGTTLDNVNLYLRKTDNTLLRASQSFGEEKERVFYDGVGGLAVKLVVSGVSVTSDGEGCGTNSMRVWVTALIEDDARNDADGPEWDDPSCTGIEYL